MLNTEFDLKKFTHTEFDLMAHFAVSEFDLKWQLLILSQTAVSEFDLIPNLSQNAVSEFDLIQKLSQNAIP